MATDVKTTKAAHGGGHEHSHGIGRYVAVWAALIVGTIITVITGKATANIFVAMAIACTKAALVVLFFMHLWDEGGVNRLVFVVSLVFLATLLLGVFGDLMFRYKPTLPYGGPEGAAAAAAEIEKQMPAGGHAPAEHH